jgi:hypothetical protein
MYYEPIILLAYVYGMLSVPSSMIQAVERIYS